MIGPTEHAGLEEGSVDDQLTAAVEQVEQTHLALGPSNSYFFSTASHGIRRRLGGQRVTRAGQRLLLHEELLPQVPFLCGADGCVPAAELGNRRALPTSRAARRKQDFFERISGAAWHSHSKNVRHLRLARTCVRSVEIRGLAGGDQSGWIVRRQGCFSGAGFRRRERFCSTRDGKEQTGPRRKANPPGGNAGRRGAVVHHSRGWKSIRFTRSNARSQARVRWKSRA